MKTFLHYVGKFSLKALITAHEYDDLDATFQKLAKLLAISPDAISYKWHFGGNKHRIKASAPCDD